MIFFWRLASIVPNRVIDFFVWLSCMDRLWKEKRKRKTNPQYDQLLYEQMSRSAIALATQEANDQHYEVPTDFFKLVLGRNLKYSSCYYEGLIHGDQRLSQAEEKMLELTVQRAELIDGQKILELGCGWGSLSLYMAQRYPKSQIFCVSNSRTQKQFIDQAALSRGLTNLQVVVADMNDFDPLATHNTAVKPKATAAKAAAAAAGKGVGKITSEISKNGKQQKVKLPRHFDRIVSVEMFEHMRNYQKLLQRIRQWLRPNKGKLFVHIFVQKMHTYFFVDDEWAGASWMARHFFSAGVMPAFDIFSHFADDLKVEKQWKVDGKNYAHTAHDWLLNHQKNKHKILELFKETYGSKAEAHRRWFYWKLFFIACRELFANDDGRQWFVGHYLLSENTAKKN